MPRYTATIMRLEANHRLGYVEKCPDYKYYYDRDARCARVTLWAVTDLEHRVWLLTAEIKQGDSRSDTRKKEIVVERNNRLLGRQILYNYEKCKGMGFIREYISGKPAKGLYKDIAGRKKACVRGVKESREYNA